MATELQDGSEIIGGTHTLELRHQVLRGVTFEDATLKNCTFRGVTFVDCAFVDCRLVDCVLEEAALAGTSLSQVRFTGCRLLGLNFAAASQLMLSLQFADCQLDYAGFSGMMLRKTEFRTCRLRGADFQNAVLDQSIFDGSDLTGALFNHASLKKTDLRNTEGFGLDPALVKLGGTRVDLAVVLDIAQRLGLRVS